jgi:hypothetical protein
MQHLGQLLAGLKIDDKADVEQTGEPSAASGASAALA